MANQIKCVLFDLDGTLINTITDLGNACDYVMKKHGFQASWKEEDYKRFVGNGMRLLVDRAFKHTLSEEELNSVLSEFKEYYNKTCLDNTDAYGGIKEQLGLLKDKGLKLAVITNKAEEAAKYIIEYIFGKGIFDLIIGQRDGMPTKPDPAGLFLALDELGYKKENAVFLGDSNVDIQTAKNAGIRCIGVTWGFRSREELEKEGADEIIASPEQITEII